MNLFKEIVSKVLLNELDSSRDKDIVNAIENARRVRIGYDDERGKRKGKNVRYIWPVAFGTHKTTGNKVVRAFQKSGSSDRGTPSWKLFRTDRIFSWDTGDRSYINDPYYQSVFNNGMFGEYNKKGDGSMGQIFAVSPLVNDKDVDVTPSTTQVGKGRITKQEVEPQAAKPEQTVEKPTQGQERFSPKTLDKSADTNYFKDKVEAPASEPVRKQDIISPVAPTDSEEAKGEENSELYNKVNGPIEKKDIIEPADNKLTSTFNDMFDRWNKIDAEEEENNEEER